MANVVQSWTSPRPLPKGFMMYLLPTPPLDLFRLPPLVGADGDDDSDPPGAGAEETDDDNADAGAGDADEETDDEDEEEKPRTYTAAEMEALRKRMKAADKHRSKVEAQLRELMDKDLKPDEKTSKELSELRERDAKNTAALNSLRLQNAFLASNRYNWHDPEDAMSLADLSNVEIDEDGTVDRKALAAALKDLATRKPHLVKRDTTSDQGSGDKMNSKRKGQGQKADRAELVKRFPVLGTP